MSAYPILIHHSIFKITIQWIFGGGFERGSASGYASYTPTSCAALSVHFHFRYDDLGVSIVNRSIELGQPVIYASMNYRYTNSPIRCLSPADLVIRVSAWGFLASQEVLQSGEGNMGLQDRERNITIICWAVFKGFE